MVKEYSVQVSFTVVAHDAVGAARHALSYLETSGLEGLPSTFTVFTKGGSACRVQLCPDGLAYVTDLETGLVSLVPI
jgi:hypothetical protein